MPKYNWNNASEITANLTWFQSVESYLAIFIIVGTKHVMLSHIPATVGANVWREPRGHGPYIDVLIMVRGWNVGHTLDTISVQTERDTLSYGNYFLQNQNLLRKLVKHMLRCTLQRSLCTRISNNFTLTIVRINIKSSSNRRCWSLVIVWD